MLEEKSVTINERYLCSIFLLSDIAISLWQQNTIQRFTGEKTEEYRNYVNWVRKENEIAVFSLYAYADLYLNKKFDVVFDIDYPEKSAITGFRIKQSIFEGRLPIDAISHGHKHLFILEFENGVPDLIYDLYKTDALEVVMPEKYTRIGLGTYESFEQFKLSKAGNHVGNSGTEI